MEENLKEINDIEMSSLLKQLIIEKNLVKEEIIEDLLIQRDKEVELLRSNKEEICYVIDYNKRALVVFNKNTNENIAAVSLANKFKKYDHENFQSWGTSSIIIDLDELQKDGEIEYKNDSLYGFIISENKTYLYNQNVDSLQFHALTDRVVFGGIPKIKDSLLPFDMCFSGTNQLISLSNRDLGEVMIFNTRENDFIAEIPVRDIGTSNKSLNVAMSEIKKRVYITDNETSILQTYSFNTKKINKRNFSNLGILGNICLSPDESTLYVLVLKPEPFLKTLDSETLEEKKLFPVKGDFFSLLDDPCDLLTLSPDNTHLFFMTYINEPEPFTPVISIINIEKEKTIKRFSIKDSVKPILLSFKKENPIFAANKSLETLLIEKNYLTKDKIKELILEIKKSKEENIVIENLIEVEQENLIIHQSEHEIIAPKKVKHIIISIEANKHIKDILLGVFWQKTEIDLTENVEENERLEKISNNIRIKLEYYDLEIVEFKNYFEEHDLETVIQREYILQTLSEEEAKDKDKVVSSLSNCLNCSAPMYGSWDCAVCGQSYEKPEDAMRRKLASLEPLANFQKGNFFILDQEKGILIEVDKYKNPIWSISKDEIGLKSLQKIFRLDNRNTIILDKENSAIFEISSKGRDVWKYAIQENTKIEHPEGFAILDSSDLIIADTNNHRVLEMDLDGNIIWEYGIKGNKGDTFNYLSYPKDIQKTYDGTYLITDSGNNRIIEIKRELNAEKGLYEIRLAWSFTKELKNPIQAYKELDNNILILDQGNKRLLQIDEKGNILFEFNTENQNENHIISKPQSFLRLKNKDILIVGDGKAVEIFQEKNIGKIIWCETIENIQQKTKIKVTKADVKIARMKFEKTKYKGKFGKSKYKEILEKIESKLKSFDEGYYMRKYGKKSFSELNNDEKTKEKRMVVNVNHYIKKYGQKNPEDDNMYVIEDDKNKKIVKSNHYMKKANEVDDELETEENNKNKVKLLNADHYINKNNDVNEEELLDENNKNKVKLVNVAHYMNKNNDVNENKVFFEENSKEKSKIITTNRYMGTHGESENEEIDEKESELQQIIEEKRKELEQKIESDKPIVLLTSGEQVSAYPIVIIDKNQNHILLLNREGQILWRYGNIEKHFMKQIKNVSLTLDKTLIVTDLERVFEVSTKNKEILWEYPCHAKFANKLKNGNIIICDEKNSKVIELDSNKNIVWEYQQEKAPSHVMRLPNNNSIITTPFEHFVKEINDKGDIIWSFGEKDISGNDKRLFLPEYATRLKNGNTLIADTRNSRIIEVTKNGDISWSYEGNSHISLISPIFAVRIKDDHTYIIHSNYKHVLEVDLSGKNIWRLIMPFSGISK